MADKKFGKFQKVDPGQRIKEQQELTDQILQDESNIKRLSQRFENNNDNNRPSRSRKSSSGSGKDESEDQSRRLDEPGMFYEKPRQASLSGSDREEGPGSQRQTGRRSQSFQPDTAGEQNKVRKLSQKFGEQFDKQPVEGGDDFAWQKSKKPVVSPETSKSAKSPGSVRNLLDMFQPQTITPNEGAKKRRLVLYVRSGGFFIIVRMLESNSGL